MTKENIPDDILTPHPALQEGSKMVLILTDNNTEDLELFYPYYRFIEEGCKVDVVTPEGGDIKCKTGYKFRNTKKIEDVNAMDYDMLYIPGGKAPAALKDEPEALRLVKYFVDAGKPVAALCHGPQVLAEAGVIAGASISAWPEVREEIEDAGATFVHKETQVSGQFVTARWPADLPVFMPEVMNALRGHLHGVKGVTAHAARASA